MSRAFLVATMAGGLLAACDAPGGPVGKPAEGGGAPGAKGGGAADLNGAGATFPYPLYSKWVAEYGRAHPGVRINYQSIGSGGGIRQITERTVDFGASDAPMSDAELAKAPGKIVHIPTTIGAVAVTYNLPGAPAGLRLDPEALAAIYLGELRRWNDPRLAGLNPGIALPDRPISVVYRSDGSGTTSVFTEYLAAVSPSWKDQVGAGKSVRFPTGLGAKGNEGVAGQVKTTPGTIGYVELAYAKQTGLPQAQLRNGAGRFVEPSIEATSRAAAGVAVPDDLRVSIVNAASPDAYPISSFTYVLLYETQPDARKGRALVEFLRWAVTDGQRLAPPLHYAPLPDEVARKVVARLGTIAGPDGAPLLPAGGTAVSTAP